MQLGSGTIEMWVGFLLLVVFLLALDLGIFNRRARVISAKAAIGWTAFYVVCAVLFGIWVTLTLGRQKGLEFFTGYLIEESLSVDNLFVMALVFGSFGVPRAYQHRVLFWGVVGAQIMRGILIVAGAHLVSRFHFIIYMFGGFLVFTAIRMAFLGGAEPDPQKNKVLRIFRRIVPTTDHFDGARFTTRVDGRLLATPLLATVVVVEAMDLIFAVDSIPAIFAITTDPFIIYTSNIFAILGLRSMYFVLASMLDRFVHLKVGLSIILGYVGVKMLISGYYEIPTLASLGFIALVLAVTIVTSMLATRKEA
jgi:tellurite resistance protein TerC